MRYDPAVAFIAPTRNRVTNPKTMTVIREKTRRSMITSSDRFVM